MEKLTREAWLQAAIAELRPVFDDHQLEIPELIRVSVGWPSAGGTRVNNRVVGQCWKGEAALDGVVQIFISPFVADPVEALAVLVHELIHACLPEAKHGKEFKDAAKELGLIGPPKATIAGNELKKQLENLATKLGSFDNARLDKLASASPEKPQTNRQLKIFCPRVDLHGEEETQYVLRGSNKVLSLGIPKCAICGTDMEKEAKDEEPNNGNQYKS